MLMKMRLTIFNGIQKSDILFKLRSFLFDRIKKQYSHVHVDSSLRVSSSLDAQTIIRKVIPLQQLEHFRPAASLRHE